MKTIKEGLCNDSLCCFFPDMFEDDLFELRKRRYTPELNKHITLDYDFKHMGEMLHSKKYACHNLRLIEENDKCFFRCAVYNEREKLMESGKIPLACTSYPATSNPEIKDAYLCFMHGEIENLHLFLDNKEIALPKNMEFCRKLVE